MASNELRWCLGFNRAVDLRSHSKRRISKKNVHRAEKMMRKAFRRWGGIPIPPEWK